MGKIAQSKNRSKIQFVKKKHVIAIAVIMIRIITIISVCSVIANIVPDFGKNTSPNGWLPNLSTSSA